jgi:hypothetical protein
MSRFTDVLSTLYPTGSRSNSEESFQQQFVAQDYPNSASMSACPNEYRSYTQ